MLQTRNARAPQAVAASDRASSTQSAERVAPPANSRLPRGSLIDIKA
ncbi:MAG TPA: hypothetical protein VHT04_04820 [Stellaceae bacterium]|nr:hypothetical protein [Stellaceae bacterium]